MADPKPISVSYTKEADYDGPAPQPFEIVGNAPVTSLPATATAAELQAGTVTAARLVSPKAIHDEIARQIAAAAA